MVSTLSFMNFYDILCARILLNYMAMPRTVEILFSAAALGKASYCTIFRCHCHSFIVYNFLQLHVCPYANEKQIRVSDDLD